MARPQFTAEEEYLINAVLSDKGAPDPLMWSYIVSGLGLAGFAAYHESIPMLLSAFVVVCGFRLFEARAHRGLTVQWRSLLEKYETAVREGTAR
jgi:hypothetical protein